MVTIGTRGSDLALLQGGCHIPLGAHATTEGSEIRWLAFLGSDDELTDPRRAEMCGTEPEAIARCAYEELLWR